MAVNILKVTIDRFEGEYAICEKEDRKMINIEKSKLPDGAKEGDVIVIRDENIVIDSSTTQERKHRLQKLMDELWE